MYIYIYDVLYQSICEPSPTNVNVDLAIQFVWHCLRRMILSFISIVCIIWDTYLQVYLDTTFISRVYGVVLVYWVHGLVSVSLSLSLGAWRTPPSNTQGPPHKEPQITPLR